MYRSRHVTALTEIYTLSLHDALPSSMFFLGKPRQAPARSLIDTCAAVALATDFNPGTSPGVNFQLILRSDDHTSELQSRLHLVCRLLLEKKNKKYIKHHVN